MKKKIIWSIIVVVILIAIFTYFQLNRKFDCCHGEQYSQSLVTSTEPMTDFKVYTNDKYGFEFIYPISWKKVEDFSGGNIVTAIYPVSYPAQDYSAIVSVYESSLDATIQNDYLLKDKPFLSIIANGISWIKIQMIDNTGNLVDAFEYLTEKNSKTYRVGGSKELSDAIISTFKFTN